MEHMPGQEEHPARPHTAADSRQDGRNRACVLTAFSYLIGRQEGNRKTQLHSISQIQTEKKGQSCCKSNGFTAVPEPETAEKAGRNTALFRRKE